MFGYFQALPRSVTYVNVQDYGADPTGVNDATSAIQSAINTVKAHEPGGVGYGGTVFFPRGTYRCASQLDLHDAVSVHLLGEGGLGTNPGTHPASRLVYSGGGAGSFLDCRSVVGLSLRHLAVLYSSNTFTGTLVDFSHSVAASDSVNNLLEGCTFYPTGNFATAKCLLSFSQTITIWVRNCNLGGALCAIRGSEYVSLNNVTYSNAIYITHNMFMNCPGTLGFIVNPGQLWEISGNTFEFMDTLGAGPTLAAVTAEEPVDGTRFGWCGSFCNNWCGDLGASFDGVIVQPPTLELNGLTIASNFFTSGGSPTLSLLGPGTGITIYGNQFSSTVIPIDLGSYLTVQKQGVAVFGNTFVYVSAGAGALVANKTGHINVNLFGNAGLSGNSDDNLTVNGHWSSNRLTLQSAPTGSLQAGAGSGASYTIAGRDVNGKISVTTGTGATSGALLDVIFGLAFDEAYADNGRPKIQLTPLTAEAAAALAYIDVDAFGSTDRFRIFCKNAPGDGVTLAWHYFAMG